MRRLYSYRFKREMPLLTEAEFEAIGVSLSARIEEITAYRAKHDCSLLEARAKASLAALDAYERLTGERLDHPDQLYWVQLSRYGRPCPSCSKPFRTPRAKLCVECGYELAAGELAGASL